MSLFRSYLPITAGLCLLGGFAVYWLQGSPAHEPEAAALQPDEDRVPAKEIGSMDTSAMPTMDGFVERVELMTSSPAEPTNSETTDAPPAIDLSSLTGTEIARLTDEELATLSNRAIGDEAILRYSRSEPVHFLSTTTPHEGFRRVLDSAAHGRAVSEEAREEARAELMRLREKIQQIVTEARKSPDFIEFPPFEATDAERKRSMASWCGHVDRIERRARPFMDESERIILQLLEVYDADVQLVW